MSEDLANIMYENEHRGDSQQSKDTLSQGFPSVSWGTFTMPSLDLTSITSSAMKMADELSQTIALQAEQASIQMQREFSKTHSEVTQGVATKQQSKLCALPWESEDESKAILADALMHQVLALSLNEKNFTDPPRGNIAKIPFSFQTQVPLILRLLEIDVNLKSLHAKLAHRTGEEQLWGPYFRRVAYLRVRIGLDDDVYGVAQITENDAIIHAPEEKTPSKGLHTAAEDTPSKSKTPPPPSAKPREEVPHKHTESVLVPSPPTPAIPAASGTVLFSCIHLKVHLKCVFVCDNDVCIVSAKDTKSSQLLRDISDMVDAPTVRISNPTAVRINETHFETPPKGSAVTGGSVGARPVVEEDDDLDIDLDDLDLDGVDDYDFGVCLIAFICIYIYVCVY